MIYEVEDISQYLKEIRKIEVPSHEQQRHFAIIGDYDNLIIGNLRLVVKIAREYKDNRLSLKDRIQAGNKGLIRAAYKYDPYHKSRSKFSSYASWWIRQAIYTEANEIINIIRIPINQVKKLSEAEIKRYKPLSLEQQLKNSDLSLGDSIGISDDDSIEKRLMNDELKKAMKETLHGLRPRDREILELYFGLNGNKEYKLGEIGKKFNLTRERIRQLKEKAITRLKHPDRSRHLKVFLN